MNRPNIDVIVGGPQKPTNYTYKTVVLKNNLPFASQVTEPNCIYVIKWDFDLGGETVTIPENCILKFEGGSLRNGTIVSSYALNITAENYQIFDNIYFITTEGAFGIRANVEWFGIVPSRIDRAQANSYNMQKALDSSNSIHLVFGPYTYYFDMGTPLIFKGNGRRLAIEGTLYALNTGTCSTISLENSPIIDTDYTNGRFKFWLNLSIIKCEIKNITILGHAGEQNAPSNATAVNALDIVGERGDIDTAIENVMFYRVCIPIRALGRGITIMNTHFQHCGGMLFKQTYSPYAYEEETYNLTAQPPYDGRIFIIDNCHFHWAGYEWAEVRRWGGQSGWFINVLYNNPAEYVDPVVQERVANSTYCGVSITNIYMDGIGNLAFFNSPVSNVIIDNIFMLCAVDSAIKFNRNAVNVTITNSKLLSDYNAVGYAHSKPENYPIYNYIVFEKSVNGLQICNNVFGVTYYDEDATEEEMASDYRLIKRECVRLGPSTEPQYKTDTIKNVIIDSNISSHCRGFAIVQNVSGSSNIFAKGNIRKIKRANDRAVSIFFYSCGLISDCILEAFGPCSDIAGFSFDMEESNISDSVIVVPGVGITYMNGIYHSINIAHDDKRVIFNNGSSSYKNADGFTALPITGTTANREWMIISNKFNPTDNGFQFFDTDLNKTVYLKAIDNGEEADPRYSYSWIEGDGAIAGVRRSGTFAQKPSSENIYIGFKYFCTDKQTTEGATNGIEIIYKETDSTDPEHPVDIWVDTLGRTIE